jgi:hypothetical protein
MAKLLASASCANLPAVRCCAGMRVILIMPLISLGAVSSTVAAQNSAGPKDVQIPLSLSLLADVYSPEMRTGEAAVTCRRTIHRL